MPIPDLTHTGIRTKFSAGAGDSFTPDGAMTEVFRTGIHETVRSLPACGGATSTLSDTRDMKTRDYARAVRRHRADPCGGSLIHAHMSSVELGGGGGGPGSAPGGSGLLSGPPALRGSSSLRSFRSRLSPPSSPLSARRRDRAGVEGLDCGTPAEDRQALLQRELRSVKLAAAAAAVGYRKRSEHGLTTTSTGAPDAPAPAGGGSRVATRSRASSRGLSRGHAEGPMGANADWATTTTSHSSKARCPDGLVSDSTFAASQQWKRTQSADWEGFDADRGAQGESDEFEFPFQDPWRSNGRRGSRGRRRRRIQPLAEGLASASTVRRTRRHRSPAITKSARRKKPFSADSLFACLLDVRYGNTRDLSREKRPGQKWDLTTLPAGITAAEAWDGFSPEVVVAGAGQRGAGLAAGSEGGQRFVYSNNDRDSGDDFIVVGGGGVTSAGEGRIQ